MGGFDNLSIVYLIVLCIVAMAAWGLPDAAMESSEVCYGLLLAFAWAAHRASLVHRCGATAQAPSGWIRLVGRANAGGGLRA